MSQTLKIAIIGDYNFTYNSHHATNLALDHSSNFLDLDISYYWIKISEVVKFRPYHFEEYDGFWIAPGPYKNEFFLHGIIRELLNKPTPTIVTGDAYRIFLEVLINLYQLNPHKEKLISDNLVDGEQFEKIQLAPHSKAFQKLYENYSKVELTSTRFSMYPQLIEALTKDLTDIEAYNQFEEPEVLSLRHHDFFLACGFCPQISSTREIPHPIIYTFLKACEALNMQNMKRSG
jgi:CTP synthase (UTP-ammonia lyase)